MSWLRLLQWDEKKQAITLDRAAWRACANMDKNMHVRNA